MTIVEDFANFITNELGVSMTNEQRRIFDSQLKLSIQTEEEALEPMIKLTLEDSGRPIGYRIEPRTEKEQEVVATVRDLTFFGFEETKMTYDGMELLDESKGKTVGNIKAISWIQKSFNPHS